MIAPSGRKLAVTLLLPLVLSVVGGAGCASTATGERGATRSSSADTSSASRSGARSGLGSDSAERQIMVLLPGNSEEQWQRIDRELRRAYSLEQIYGWPMDSLGEVCMIYRVPGKRPIEQVAARLAADRRLRGAQPINTFRLLTQSAKADNPPPNGVDGSGRPQRQERPKGSFNDPYSNLQHSVTSLRLAGVHRRATGQGVRLAVVDTGIDVDHPDLQGRVIKARNFVDEGQESFTSDIHGTAVAGVIAASVNNGIGIVGIAPGVELVALKACWQDSPDDRAALCNSYTLAKAFDFALGDDVDVINLSLTGPDDPLLERLIDRAVERGVVVIAAAEVEEARPARDGGPGIELRFGFPASLPSVLAIRSSDLSERLSEPLSSSTLQEGVPEPEEGAVVGLEDRRSDRLPDQESPHFAREDLAAPGIDVLTTVPRDSYDFLSGSSLAAAHASGIAALLLEVHPEMTAREVRSVLRQTGRPIRSSATAEALSFGRLLDACAAVEAIVGERFCPR